MKTFKIKRKGQETNKGRNRNEIFITENIIQEQIGKTSEY